MAMNKSKRDEYYRLETKELWGGKGDLMFYAGAAFTLLSFFTALVNKFIMLTGFAGIFLMFYAIKYDWKRMKTGIGKTGNVIALLLALFITLIYLTVLAVVIVK